MSSTKDLLTRFLGEPLKNIAHSLYDEYVEANVRFRTRSGMKTFIVRRELAKCCDWCRSLAGIYEYGKEPKGVYQRHDSCRCMVTYRNEEGKYTDVWTKQEYNSQREARITRANEIKISQLRKEKSDRLIREYADKATPGKGSFEIEKGVKQKKEANAIYYARIIHKMYGGDIKVLKAINENGVKTPDYLWKNKYWEHKSFTTRNSVYHQVKSGIKQIKKKPGGLVLQRTNRAVPIEVIEDEIIRTFSVYGPKYGVKTADVIIFDQEEVIRILRLK